MQELGGGVATDLSIAVFTKDRLDPMIVCLFDTLS